MKSIEIIRKCKDFGVHLELDGGDILAGPRHRLTDELRVILRERKPEIVESLAGLYEAQEERAATLEYDYGMDRRIAESEAARRIQLVTCASCTSWTSLDRCSAGLRTSGNNSRSEIRICGYYAPKGRKQ